MSRFEYQILDSGEIEILINGRDIKGPDGKSVDAFTQKRFTVTSKELMEFDKVLTRAMFAWVAKFKCSIDKPACF